jgi:hypothetical protein
MRIDRFERDRPAIVDLQAAHPDFGRTLQTEGAGVGDQAGEPGFPALRVELDVRAQLAHVQAVLGDAAGRRRTGVERVDGRGQTLGRDRVGGDGLQGALGPDVHAVERDGVAQLELRPELIGALLVTAQLAAGGCALRIGKRVVVPPGAVELE